MLSSLLLILPLDGIYLHKLLGCPVIQGSFFRVENTSFVQPDPVPGGPPPSLSGDLEEHLHAIDADATHMADCLIARLSRSEGLTEALKTADPLAWVCRMNSSTGDREQRAGKQVMIAAFCAVSQQAFSLTKTPLDQLRARGVLFLTLYHVSIPVAVMVGAMVLALMMTAAAFVAFLMAAFVALTVMVTAFVALAVMAVVVAAGVWVIR